jgi:predicted TIM-barrel fold metal-dependent hydrolase
MDVHAEDLILVSVDDHIVEPPDVFEGRVPTKYVDVAPRVIRKDDGTDVWIYLGAEVPNIGVNAVAGRPPEEYGMEPTSFDELRPGCYDVHERVKDMSANGVLGSLNFPSFPRFCGQLFAQFADRDSDQALAMIRAYNDWHIDAWCGAYPDRFIPLAIPPIWDPHLMAAEVRRVAEKGCHAITFSENPFKLGLPSLHSDHWDPFWAACEELGTVVCLHLGSASTILTTAPDAPLDVQFSLAQISLFSAASDLVWAPIFGKFKALRVALSEGGIGWVPYFLERADFTYEHQRAWTGSDLGGRRPSEIFKEHVVTCFIDDAFGVANRSYMNIDMITWECDYPHSDSTWPHAPEHVAKYLAGVPRDEIDKITHLNAMRIFAFDPFAIRAKDACRAGALRDEVRGHDVSLVARGNRVEKARTSGQWTDLLASLMSSEDLAAAPHGDGPRTAF